MRIKLLRTIGKKDTQPRSSDYASLELPAKADGSMYQEGEVAEFSQEDANKLIKASLGAETSDPVGPPPPAPVFGVAPIPVTVVPARVDPPANPPGNKDNRATTGGK